MTKDKAIAELVRIWHSPHLDLSLKAGLAEAIDALKENNQSDSLVRDEADACKESESKLDLISRQDAIEVLTETIAPPSVTLDTPVMRIDALPSAEVVLQTPQTYGKSINPNTEIISDLIRREDAIKAIRKCKFDSNMPTDWYQGMETAQDIVGKVPSAEARPTGEWLKSTWSIRCSECGYDMPFAVRNFCPNCGAKMTI